jgi:hypothetical protein
MLGRWAAKHHFERTEEEQRRALRRALVESAVDEKLLDHVTARDLREQELEQEAEKGLADQLFGGGEAEVTSPTLTLNSEKEYKLYG